jgi:hypothetical protein
MDYLLNAIVREIRVILYKSNIYGGLELPLIRPLNSLNIHYYDTISKWRSRRWHLLGVGHMQTR